MAEESDEAALRAAWPFGAGAADAAAPDPSPAAPYEWVCGDCDWRAPVYGRAMREFSAALSHAYPRGKPPDQRHTIQGLYDRATGERLMGLSNRVFRRHFGLEAGGAGATAVPPAAGEAAEAEAPPPGTKKRSGGKAAGGASGGGGAGPTRRLRVLAQDVEVSDVVTMALHLVARRLPELLPPDLLADETAYTRAMARFIEDAVVVLLDQLTRTYPDRFTPQDAQLALVAQAAAERLDELEVS
jgi:hypothetical protein